MIHNFSIRMIDLSKTKTIDEVKKMFDFNGLLIDVESFVEGNPGFDKIFIDSATSNIIGWTRAGSETITFDADFIEAIELMPSISPKLSVEVILKKIRETGIDSLNRKEVDFLENKNIETVNFNIKCFDFDELSPEEFTQALEDNDVYGLDADKVADLLNKDAKKIYFDATTHDLVGYSVKWDGFYDFNFLDTFLENLKWMPEMMSEEPEIHLTIDSILEKISKVGFDNLSKKEKAFLDSASKEM